MGACTSKMPRAKDMHLQPLAPSALQVLHISTQIATTLPVTLQLKNARRSTRLRYTIHGQTHILAPNEEKTVETELGKRISVAAVSKQGIFLNNVMSSHTILGNEGGCFTCSLINCFMNAIRYVNLTPFHQSDPTPPHHMSPEFVTKGATVHARIARRLGRRGMHGLFRAIQPGLISGCPAERYGPKFLHYAAFGDQSYHCQSPSLMKTAASCIALTGWHQFLEDHTFLDLCVGQGEEETNAYVLSIAADMCQTAQSTGRVRIDLEGFARFCIAQGVSAYHLEWGADANDEDLLAFKNKFKSYRGGGGVLEGRAAGASAERRDRGEIRILAALSEWPWAE